MNKLMGWWCDVSLMKEQDSQTSESSKKKNASIYSIIFMIAILFPKAIKMCVHI